jgi:hypothetical protein
MLARDHCSVPHINMTISLAFHAPDLVRAAVGSNASVKRPRSGCQFEALGFNPPTRGPLAPCISFS